MTGTDGQRRSTPRPGPVRITDLAEPQFSDEVKAILGFMAEAGNGLVLQPEPLMEAAAGETGLDDFGPRDFVERLDVLCRAMRDQGRFNGAGVLSQHTLLVGLLKNRLLIEDLIKRHPEILEVRIVAPIIICGLPRTGTTHLHNLMSADPALRTLPYWESVEPVLVEAEKPRPGESDPRLARTEMALSFVDAGMPYFKRMHEMTVDHAHEEIQLLAIDFSTMFFDTLAPMPAWRDYYLAHDQSGSYAYLYKVLQVLQWSRGGTRWVLKSPQHLEQFPILRRTFPDATFVVTHRDPVSVTASMVTMIGYTQRLSHDRVDLTEVGGYWADRIERMLRQCVEDRDALPADQTVDVRFDDFMAGDLAMVERVYALAGQPYDERARAAMGAFMADHPRGRHGGVEYDLTEFGLDPDERRRALAFYREPVRGHRRGMTDLELATTAMASNGQAIARDESGKVVFVDGALPAERVRAETYAEHAKFSSARVTEVVEPSADRVTPRCRHVADGCGGCQWQHIAPAAQRRLKEEIITGTVRRVGRFDPPPCRPTVELEPWAYRTTLRARVVEGRAALRRIRSDEAVAIDGCLVAHPLLAELIDGVDFSGAEEVVLRCGARTGERLVAATPRRARLNLPAGVQRQYFHEEAVGQKWRISAPSFFQTRADGVDALAALVNQAAAEVADGGGQPGRAIDLYSGVGLFAGVLAGAGWDVVAVEGSKSAVEDAKVNLAAWPVPVQVVQADVQRWPAVPADLVVADPSRAGLGTRGVAAVVGTRARRVVLISCDAASLGRDAGLLRTAGYELRPALAPVDLFPHTFHVEVVAVFDHVAHSGTQGYPATD